MFSTELEARLKPHREAYNATVNGWLLDRTFGITYPALLLETYHYVKHSCSLMDRAHDRLGPLDATLRTYLRTHRTEETGHEAWLLDDLAVLGYDRTEATQSAPLAETVAMIGSQLYVIDYCSPAGLIGYIYVMESKPPSEFFLSVLHEEFGLPREALTFLTRHGDADVRHREELCDILDTCFTDPDARRAAITSATLGLSCVVRLFQRLRSGDYLDSCPAPVPPISTPRKEALYV
jgi:pyrroloquinoline quinone (PQQ) biosynthesis protein C